MVLDSADAYWLAVDADDNVGISMTAAGDLNSDGYDDLIIGGSRADGDGDGEDEGAAWIVYGPVSSGTMGSVEDADVVMVGNSSGDYFGYRVANLGDIDGDLLPDVGPRLLWSATTQLLPELERCSPSLSWGIVSPVPR